MFTISCRYDCILRLKTFRSQRRRLHSCRNSFYDFRNEGGASAISFLHYECLLLPFTAGGCGVIPVAFIVQIFEALCRGVVAANRFCPEDSKKLSQWAVRLRRANRHKSGLLRGVQL